MKRLLTTLFLASLLLALPAKAAVLTLDGNLMQVGETPVRQGTTYVPLRAMVEALCPQAQISWENGQAVVRWDGNQLIARPGERSILYNNGRISMDMPVQLEEGRTLIPLRPLCALFDTQVDWFPGTSVAALTSQEALRSSYGEDELYWLSRIISAESQGECWEGKIAVGNVVLNRVRSREFPDTIYGVIFDDRWGGQFEPVRNGTVYHTPTEESVRAAVACLNGENTVGDSLYFLAPALTNNHWTMENRDYVTTIGAHWFYR